ncbi:hypothetical protein L3V82_10760 [Thiotrichales bacterium 19S3-7]|nr:hypothetical protein [Thiotrichales bacterium 19S3-7]MCF6802638.1 hypothetical protein [Thiotrichales bacterium 19S3-11]
MISLAVEGEKQYPVSNISNACSCQVTGTEKNFIIKCVKKAEPVNAEFCRIDGQDVSPISELDVGQKGKTSPTNIGKGVEGFCVRKSGDTQGYATIDLSQLQNPNSLYVVNFDVPQEKINTPVVMNATWVDYSFTSSSGSCQYQGPQKSKAAAIFGMSD